MYVSVSVYEGYVLIRVTQKS